MIQSSKLGKSTKPTSPSRDMHVKLLENYLGVAVDWGPLSEKAEEAK